MLANIAKITHFCQFSKWILFPVRITLVMIGESRQSKENMCPHTLSTVTSHIQQELETLCSPHHTTESFWLF
jgi:hypothetical protein